MPPSQSLPATEEGQILTYDGLALRWIRWDPPARPRGTIVLTHGLGEHAGRYHHVAGAFVDAGFVVLAYDLRGHGRSAGRRGHAPTFRHYLEDLAAVLRLASVLPRIAYGHSMGGLISLHHGLKSAGDVDAVIATSPWLRLRFPAPAAKVAMARALYRILPGMTLSTGLEQAALSRDTSVVAAYAADPLVHDRLSIRVGLDLLNGGQALLDQADRFTLPVLLMHGEADRLTDPAATVAFYQTAGSDDKTLRLWPGLVHETHNEPEWKDVLEVSTGWARAHAGSTGSREKR